MKLDIFSTTWDSWVHCLKLCRQLCLLVHISQILQLLFIHLEFPKLHGWILKFSRWIGKKNYNNLVGILTSFSEKRVICMLTALFSCLSCHGSIMCVIFYLQYNANVLVKYKFYQNIFKFFSFFGNLFTGYRMG